MCALATLVRCVLDAVQRSPRASRYVPEACPVACHASKAQSGKICRKFAKQRSALTLFATIFRLKRTLIFCESPMSRGVLQFRLYFMAVGRTGPWTKLEGDTKTASLGRPAL